MRRVGQIPFENWRSRNLSLDNFIKDEMFILWEAYFSIASDEVIEEFMTEVDYNIRSNKYSMNAITSTFSATKITMNLISEYVKRVIEFEKKEKARLYFEEKEKERLEKLREEQTKKYLQSLRNRFSKEEWYTGIKSENNQNVLLQLRESINKAISENRISDAQILQFEFNQSLEAIKNSEYTEDETFFKERSYDYSIFDDPYGSTELITRLNILQRKFRRSKF